MPRGKVVDINWPPALISVLAEHRGILVLGSGVSATALTSSNESPPDWPQLLRALTEDLIPNDVSRIEEMLDSKRYLDAAQILVANCEKASFDLTLRRLLDEPDFRPSIAHRAVQQLNSRLILNLNYDNVYENTLPTGAEGSVICPYYDSSLSNYVRGSRRLLVKMHGTVNDGHRIILSKSQYAEAKTEHPSFYNVIDALIKTHTLFFIGCGFNGDPDIDLLLQNAVNDTPSTSPHYAFVPEGGDLPEVRDANSKSMNVHFIPFPTPTDKAGKRDYSNFGLGLQELADIVLAERGLSV